MGTRTTHERSRRIEVADKHVPLKGRYRLLEPLGEGGMSVVYAGVDEVTEQKVAVKVLHAHLARRAEDVERLRREAAAASRIGNEHIVQVIDFGRSEDGDVCLVMERLDGRELRGLCDEGPLDADRAIHIARSCCEALQAAHEQGIVHRDLKPRNVFLVERDGDPDFVKILDFGVAKFIEESLGPDAITRLTHSSAAPGTPGFMAPEQIEGLPDVDARADVYALGVILFRMLTGEMPFTAKTYPELVRRICEQPTPLVRSIRTELSADLEAVVAKAMAKDRNERYQSCLELAASLDQFARSGRVRTPRAAPRRSIRALLTLASIALIGGLVAIFGWREPEPNESVVAAPQSQVSDEEPTPAPAPALATPQPLDTTPPTRELTPPEPPVVTAQIEPVRTSAPRRRRPRPEPTPEPPASTSDPRQPRDPVRSYDLP